MYVVTLPSSAANDPLTYAKRAVEAGAHILEIRSDMTPDVPAFDSPLPLLIALRGNGDTLLRTHSPAYVDIKGTGSADIPENVLCIRSYHDYNGTPPLEELQTVVKELSDEGADIVKMVTTVNSYADVAVLDALQEAISSKQKRIVLGMGVRAHSTRMLSPFRNALTYTYLEEGEEAAAGQVPLALHLRTEHCTSPNVYGILGGLDVKSFSPHMQNAFNESVGYDGIFTAFLTDDLEDAWSYICKHGVNGCAVTTPWKKEIIPLLDRLDASAQEMRAVNTVVREGDEWVGFMFDSLGIVEGYPFLGDASSVAIIGSGGVVGAIIAACKKCAVSDIHVYARNEAAREELRDTWSVFASPLSALPDSTADVVICAVNTDIDPDLPPAQAGAHAIDLRYGKSTKFLEKAILRGYATHDGLPMLIHQAIAQCRLFTGTAPDLRTWHDLLHSLSFYGKQ